MCLGVCLLGELTLMPCQQQLCDRQHRPAADLSLSGHVSLLGQSSVHPMLIVVLNQELCSGLTYTPFSPNGASAGACAQLGDPRRPDPYFY